MGNYCMWVLLKRHLDTAFMRHSQHGFLKVKSCLRTSGYDNITCLSDEGKAVDVVFLALYRAFDSVPHSILLDKRSNCEMNRYIVCWVMNWLDVNAQRVVVSGSTSRWWQVTSDVPQGSIV